MYIYTDDLEIYTVEIMMTRFLGYDCYYVWTD